MRTTGQLRRENSKSIELRCLLTSKTLLLFCVFCRCNTAPTGKILHMRPLNEHPVCLLPCPCHGPSKQRCHLRASPRYICFFVIILDALVYFGDLYLPSHVFNIYLYTCIYCCFLHFLQRMPGNERKLH